VLRRVSAQPFPTKRPRAIPNHDVIPGLTGIHSMARCVPGDRVGPRVEPADDDCEGGGRGVFEGRGVIVAASVIAFPPTPRIKSGGRLRSATGLWPERRYPPRSGGG